MWNCSGMLITHVQPSKGKKKSHRSESWQSALCYFPKTLPKHFDVFFCMHTHSSCPAERTQPEKQACGSGSGRGRTGRTGRGGERLNRKQGVDAPEATGRQFLLCLMLCPARYQDSDQQPAGTKRPNLWSKA